MSSIEKKSMVKEQIKVGRAKHIWDATNDVKEVAKQLGISESEALRVCGLFVSEDQLNKNQKDI